jgi:hypothetical protein
LVRPVTVAEVAPDVVALCPPGVAVTVYPVIGEPPSLAGGVHDTPTWVFPGTTATAVGAPGTVRGVTAALATDTADVPAALVAVTVNVYAVPFVRPVTVADRAPVDVAVRPPGDAVTVYPVMGELPSLAGAAHDTAT